MSNRAIIWLTGIAIASVLILLFLNAKPMIWTPQTEKYVKNNDVRGSAIEHNQILYTLSFSQQNDLVGFLNRAVPLKEVTPKKEDNLEVTKIIIYRFNNKDLIITPIAYQNGNLIFSSPELNKDGLMRDVSGGALKKLLSETFDK